MENRNFNELLDELKKISDELNSDSNNMEESLKSFDEACKIIKIAKDKLENIEGEVKKVLEDNGVTDFNF